MCAKLLSRSYVWKPFRMHMQVISRNEEDFTKERKQDLKKVHRNYDPNIHQVGMQHAPHSSST